MPPAMRWSPHQQPRTPSKRVGVAVRVLQGRGCAGPGENGHQGLGMSEAGEAMEQSEQRAAEWAALAEAAFSEVTAWRQQHPTATVREIETTIDERLATLRAQMLQDTALASAAADLRSVAEAERPGCPQCGQPLQPRGQQVRHLTTAHEQPVVLTRSDATCPACGAGLFPPG